MIDLYALSIRTPKFTYARRDGLPYKEIFVECVEGRSVQAGFLKINPNGKIPTIVDHDGPGGEPYTVFESGAILLISPRRPVRFCRATAPGVTTSSSG